MREQDHFVLQLSALVDGELERDELLSVLDVLMADEEARRSYLRLRRLDEVVRAAELPGSLPARLWRAIKARVGVSVPARTWPWLRPVPIPAWALGAAAVILLTAIVWGNLPTTRSAARPQPGVTIQVDLGADKTSMDDQRFVELTAEILRADRRYHRKMLEVMEEVSSQAFIAEGTGDGGGGEVPREERRTAPRDGARVSG